jgi:septum formation protein
METIILASGSSLRHDYFKLMGLPFRVVPANIDEDLENEKDPYIISSRLAVLKTQKVMAELKNPLWICAADTVIAQGNKIFGKPKNRDEAEKMLRFFSGKRHNVVTSLALYSKRTGKIDCRNASCFVFFSEISDPVLEWYLNTGEWQNAAGAYRLQGLGACLIKKINGSPGAVAGLPLSEFFDILINNGYLLGLEPQDS